MRRALAAAILTLTAAAAAFAQSSPAQSSPAAEARRQLDAGARAYRYGRYEEAEQHFRRALELDPESKNARLYIARTVQQQYKPGDASPENVAAGERAVAAYQEIMQRDPQNEDAYKSVLFLYGQMKNEERVRELLLARANNFSLPNEKRAEAFAVLASRQWQCSFDLTERKENKKTAESPAGGAVTYTMPADQGDFLRARQCVTEGLTFAEQAVALDPKSANARSYKGNLLREAAKLAEMEGDAGQKAEYERQSAEAFGAQSGLAGSMSGGRSVTNVVGDPAGPPVAPQDTAGGRRSVVKGGILNGKAVSKPQPAYPAEARAAGAQGTVTVRVLVDEGGNVVEAQAVGGPELLREAAVTAARQARFSPTLLSGQPVKVTGHITYNFVLQ